MFRPHCGEQVVGVELMGRHPAEPERDIRQCAMNPSEVLIDDKSCRIDQNVSSGKLWVGELPGNTSSVGNSGCSLEAT